MKEKEKTLKGKKYLCLVRCSTAQQADTSIPDQLKLLRAFGDEEGMTYIDSIVLDGVSGSIPGARTDIAEIIQRKKMKDDFQILLVQDLSRFTRGGAEHGFKMEYDLNTAGVDVIFVVDRLPEGDHSSIIKTVGYYAAQQTAKSLSFATTRGSMSSLEQGRIAHALHIPYGIDRLMVSLDGKPLHVIRNLADGTQQKRHPETGEVLATFGCERGQNRAVHYRMQSNEKVVLIPGEAERVEAVCHMFRRRLIDGWAGSRIAQELDQMGVRSGNGRPWSVSSINSILKNPVYVGVGIANRYSSGIYNRRSKNAPKPSMTDRKSLATRKKPKAQIRPREEWIEIEYRQLRDYLGDLRDRAVAWQQEQLKKQDRSRVSTPSSKDRHVDSSYFLKGILKSSDGHALSGRTTGTPNKTRYYAINRGFTAPTKDKMMRRLINADLLEQSVLNMVQEILLSTPDLRPRLIKEIKTQRAAVNSKDNNLTSLEKDRTKIGQQIEFAIDSLGSLGREAATKKLQQLESKLTAIVDRIKQMQTAHPVDDRSAETVADDMIADMTKLASKIKTLPTPTLRSILTALIVRLEVDMTTKAVEIELAIPVGMNEKALCLEDKFAQRSVNQAQMKIPLDSAKCGYRRAGRIPCLDCQRHLRAA